MNVPEQFRYSDEHEWIETLEDGTVRVGITDYAQDQLGDVVFVDIAASSGEIEAGAVLGEVESTKSVAEVYAPFSGTVVSVNDKLADSPELVNSDPYGEGWFAVIRPTEANAADAFIDATAYRALIE